MKKIKLLLGIGLLGALFSTCFGVRITAFEYYYNNGQTSYSFDGMGRNFKPIMNIDNGFNTGLILNYKYGYSSTDTGVLLLSSYLQSGISLNFLENISRDFFHIYFNPDLNFIGLIQNRTSSSSSSHKYFYYKFTTGDYVSSAISGFNVSSNISSFIRVNSDFENCLQNGWFNGNCVANRFFIHTTNSTYDSFTKSDINDSLDNGITYNKGPVVSVIGDAYSYFMSNGLGTGSSDLNSSTFIPRIRVPDSPNSSGYTINGLFAMKLNTYSKIPSNLSNYQVLVLQITGFDTQNYDFIYSIYDCPGDSYFLSSCTFNEGGYLRPSTDTYHFQSSGDSLIVLDNTGRDNLLFLLSYPFGDSFTPNYSSTLYNSYDSLTNTLTIYRPLLTSASDYNVKNRGYSLTLQSTQGIDILDGVVFPGGNGNQSSFPDPIFDGGVFDANTFLIEESIKCYLTSGEVCNAPFTYENSTNYVNNYDHQERVRNSADKTGYLTFNNSVDMLSQYCLNVNSIQYAFCSQLYLYEGSPITYYYNNGYFNYIVSGSGFQVNLGALWSGQLGYAYCDGPYCSQFNQGLPQFIRKDTGDYSAYGFSGEYVSLDFFKNYFEEGFFFQCPFSYSGSYFTIGSKLIDRLDQHDPLKPINCFISAFSHGVKSSFFGDSKLGLSHSGVFLQNTGPFAIRFYTFIDVVLCLGYIFLFSKLFKFLKKH